jgi:hypothetical protein
MRFSPRVRDAATRPPTVTTFSLERGLKSVPLIRTNESADTTVGVNEAITGVATDDEKGCAHPMTSTLITPPTKR